MNQHVSEPSDAYGGAVVGGGAAGLSAAVALLRSGRSVVVIDDDTPRNAAAGHVHNLFTRDRTPPAELFQLGRAEVERYGGRRIARSADSSSPSTFRGSPPSGWQRSPASRSAGWNCLGWWSSR